MKVLEKFRHAPILFFLGPSFSILVTEMLSIVTFKFDGHRKFTSEHVEKLFSMVKRNYQGDFHFYCVTDSIEKEKSPIRYFPIWDTPQFKLPDPRKPNCYRRLKLFDSKVKETFSALYPDFYPRVVQLDLDTVIVKDVTPLFNTPGDFVGYNKRGVPYQGAFYIHEIGTRQYVWDNLTERDASFARRTFEGSDQSWMSFSLPPSEKVLTKKDGIFCYDLDLFRKKAVPPDCRMVIFRGGYKPWDPKILALPWVTENYR